MKLRDSNDSLDDICSAEGAGKDEVIKRLKDAGFEYVPEINQFR